jgi:REP element-mobilizing transposase RayT
MPQSLARVWIHLIFSTKHRYPFLKDDAHRRDMHGFLATTLRTLDCETLIVGGVEDHIHGLFALSRNYSIATVVKEIKRTSSAWIKEIAPRLAKFHWQNGYGAFSVSQSDIGEVHHKRVTFQDEYRAFLRAYRVPYDERYAWD